MRRTLLSLALAGALLGAPAVTPGVLAAEELPFEPTVGVTFNDPTRRSTSNLILRQVLESVRNTLPGEQIRVATWNFDDEASVKALVDAAQRGVKVQVVVSGAVANPNWRALRQALNNDASEETFAVQCQSGCRSRSPIMHTKMYLFSRVG